MLFCTLASGSAGNSSVVSDGHTGILIDAGISARRIVNGIKALDIGPDSLDAILITHEHSDHIQGLATLLGRCSAKVFAPAAVAACITYKIPGCGERIVPFREGDGFAVGGLYVETFATAHDAAASAGFSVRCSGKKISCVTDLGHVTDVVREGIYGADLILLEANHDVERLKNGSYPAFLKRRILGKRGHLSNGDGGNLAALAATGRTRRIVLAHLSRENNTPGLAFSAVEHALDAVGAVVGRDLELAVAPAGEMGKAYVV